MGGVPRETVAAVLHDALVQAQHGEDNHCKQVWSQEGHWDARGDCTQQELDRVHGNEGVSKGLGEGVVPLVHILLGWTGWLVVRRTQGHREWIPQSQSTPTPHLVQPLPLVF